MTEPKINEKAPERLFAWSFNNWKEWGGWVRGNTRGDTDLGPFNEKERSTGSEYVRADLFDALSAERDALRAAITDALGRYQVTHIHEGLRAALNNLTPPDETAD